MKKLKADNSLSGTRLDKAASEIADISRSLAAKLIEGGYIKVNNDVKKPSYILCEDDEIEINAPESADVDIAPQAMPLDIVYEDKHIIVINKQRDLVVHPSAGHDDMTLVNGLLFHCKDIKGIGAEKRPGIVHRIDKDTTGLLAVAKNDKAMASLADQIQSRTMKRKYIALVEGKIEGEGCVEANIGRSKKERKKQAVANDGRYAKTNYKVIKNYTNYTLIEAELDTGRTHQIRVHMAYIGHPVVGDKLYGYKKQKFNLDGQLLHAYELELIHPQTGKKMVFNAPMPEDFKKIVDTLDKKECL
ncbi:MAG: RluA family pseudouridine synthase [Clostridia bacterium]|nr:RluA family pseudouridine synthase [Clostridia bacterium]